MTGRPGVRDRIGRVLAGAAICVGMAAEAPAVVLHQGVPPFETPAFVDRVQGAAALLARDPAAAAAAARRLTDRHPAAPAAWTILATALALQGRGEEAVAALSAAAAAGFGDIDALLATPAFAAVRDDPRVRALEPATPPPPPAARAVPVREGIAPVVPDAASWDPARRTLTALLDFTEGARSAPLVSAAEAKTPAARALLAERPVAGHLGDVYDNRDRGHAVLEPIFPQLATSRYDRAAVEAGLDLALNGPFRFDATVIGNASLAVTGGPNWRSLPRLALTTGGGAAQLFELYAANHLYVYPAHDDHVVGRGDLFPAYTPYVVIASGSSGSDLPFVRALAYMLAALRPDVKATLRAEGLIAPTLQMLLRRSLRGVESDADYMSGAAHVTALPRGALDPPAAIRRAAALRLDEIPPMARLSVVAEEALGAPNRIFADGLDETLFDTPAAAARIARGVAGVRRYRLDAASTKALGDAPLRFHWRLLRGDPELVDIEPIGPTGAAARVSIAWHEPTLAPGAPGLISRRVDVAVFADNGVTLSAPAVFSLAFPPGQRRRYRADGAPLEIAYADPEQVSVYVDPALYPRRAWRDVYAYDDAGAPLGWTRRWPDGRVERFAASGARRGPDGEEQFPRYPVVPLPDGNAKVTPSR